MLDLYTNHRSSTIVGPIYPVDKFLNIRITLNQEASASGIPPYSQPKSAAKASSNSKKHKQHLTNGVNGGKEGRSKKAKHSPLSPRDREGNHLLASPTSGGVTSKPGVKEGTVRFMLSAERARDEKVVVDEYFRMVEEEELVEVPIGEVRRRR